MSIAFSTIIIFLFIAPGFVWRIGYLSSKYSSKFSGRNFLVELTWSVVPAIILQALWIMLISIFSYEIDFILLGRLIVGSPTTVDEDFLKIGNQILEIFFYNISLLPFSLAMGHFTRYLIRRNRLDRIYENLKFSNKWQYLLSGEFLDFDNIPDNYFEISYTVIDVLVNTGHKNVIYIGELVDFETDRNGNLELIHIRYPMRRDLNNDEEVDTDKYYLIPSNYLIIPYKDVINLNVRLMEDKEVTEEEATNSGLDIVEEEPKNHK